MLLTWYEEQAYTVSIDMVAANVLQCYWYDNSSFICWEPEILLTKRVSVNNNVTDIDT